MHGRGYKALGPAFAFPVTSLFKYGFSSLLVRSCMPVISYKTLITGLQGEEIHIANVKKKKPVYE